MYVISNRGAFGERMVKIGLTRRLDYATPSEVRALLAQHAGHLLDFVEEPEAAEWRQSEGERRRTSTATLEPAGP